MDVSNLFSLDGRTAFVTGGSRGIGRMIAEGFLASGAKVYITARKEEECRAAAEEMSAAGECVALPADISDAAGIADVVGRLRQREQRLDILVNNAGAAWSAPFDEFPESGWDKVMDLNSKSLFFLTQRLAPELRAAASPERRAKVINIASIDGMSVNPMETYSYQASKAGVIHLTKRLALRLIGEDIVVNGIAPGPFASNMNKEARDHAEELSAIIPAGRIGAPEEMAGAAIFLASRAGDYVVGSMVTVDGGITYAR